MIKLPDISQENINKFLDDLKPKLIEWCKSNISSSDYKPLFNYLLNGRSGVDFDDQRIKKILIGNKTELEEIIDTIGKIDDKEIIKLYNGFVSRKLGKTWAEINGVTTCPYCNRNYIFTINKKDKTIKPEYDHYFSKSSYPYLCVSMYNLIPCCSICNKAKGSFNVLKKKTGGFIYPYIDEYGYDTVFSIKYDTITDLIDGHNIMIDITKKDGSPITNKALINTINRLATKDLYEKHLDYVRNILKLAHIYSDDFIKGLSNDFDWLPNDLDKSRNVLFLSNFDKSEWIKSTLSKLTYDIVSKYGKFNS